jgi:hypothetical protein
MDMLTEDCLDSLLNLEITNDITSVMYSILKGIPKEIVDAQGNKIDYISITPVPGTPKKK